MTLLITRKPKTMTQVYPAFLLALYKLPDLQRVCK